MVVPLQEAMVLRNSALRESEEIRGCLGPTHGNIAIVQAVWECSYSVADCVVCYVCIVMHSVPTVVHPSCKGMAASRSGVSTTIGLLVISFLNTYPSYFVLLPLVITSKHVIYWCQ